MTDREKAIVMAHTGKCMLTGDKFQIFHKYVEDIMGRPIQTLEMGIGSIADEIKEKSKADFIALCAGENSSEQPNRCEDAISRQAAIDAANKVIERDTSGNNDVVNAMIAWSAYIKSLPPVTPQPCEDAISRQGAIVALDGRMSNLENVDMQIAMGFAKGIIHDLPPVNPQPKTGHWEWVQYDSNPNIGNWQCSECRCVVVECVDKKSKGDIPLYKYCPQCGCRMVEPQESEG